MSLENNHNDATTTVVTTEERVVAKNEIFFSIGDEADDGKDHHRDQLTQQSDEANTKETAFNNTETVLPKIDEDHTPHQLFCEMDEIKLLNSDQNPEWKEAARWVKFEEDVENGGRWSKPHVATLSLHSLFELRSCIFNGIVLLDLNCDDMVKISDTVIDELVKAGHVEEHQREYIKSILLARHVHQHEKQFRKQLDNGETKPFPLIKSLAEMGKKVSNSNFMRDYKESREAADAHNTTAPTALNASVNFLSASNQLGFLKENSTNHSFETSTNASQLRLSDSHNDSNKSKINAHFMKKIPSGAEASNVLIGEVESLDRQLIAFIRLSRSVLLGDLTEVPVPTRFMFILLGPTGQLPRYHEIGRSIATLMSDEIFHDVAYKALNRQDLLSGVDEFLDQVTVLPPGEWHPNIRLDPPIKVLEKEERLELLAESSKKNNQQYLPFQKSIDKPCSEHSEDDPTLQCTGRFCGGLLDDIRRKAPWYLSDFRDGLSFQCLSSILFLYFACLSPIITFGGLLGTATDNNMASIESLLSGAVCGILYHLFAGQPMTILGSTGPVLVFETIVNTFCKRYDIDYMGFRAWIGIWIMIILILIVLTDLSFLVKFITRFTEESFAVLIAFIFIRESIMKLIRINDDNKFTNKAMFYQQPTSSQSCYECMMKQPFVVDKSLNSSLAPVMPSYFANYSYEQCTALGPNFEYVKTCDVFLFSVLLYLFTFTSAMILKNFKTSRFLPSLFRSKVSDFGVVITIICAVAIDRFVGLATPKLTVPTKFETTIADRGWFINPVTRNSDKWWLAFAAIIPAVLATILIFMDQHITAVIVNRKENKLKKGAGYHLDLLIVAICIGINSLLGIPWFVAATVLSINHVLSLKIESESAAPGEKPKFLGVIEQRLTGVVVFILIGCSVFMTSLLQIIPMPVLYAVFLYMGISSLRDIQFIQRLLILFMPEKYQPAYSYLRHVRTFKVHLFTFIQFSCLALLLIIKLNKSISIIFPIMVLALVFIRKLMDYAFTQKELSYLDDIMPDVAKKQKDEDNEDSEINSESNSSNNTKPCNINDINISNELLKTSIWKQIVNSDKSINDNKKYAKEKARKDSVKQANKTVKCDESINMPLLSSDTPDKSISRKSIHNDDNKSKRL